MTKQKLQIILMIILVILLGLFFFKEPIFKYLKRREITREVLGRVSMYNVPEIATACYYYLKDQETSESHIETYQNCEDLVDEYWPKIQNWNNLIKENRDLNCNDFVDGKDAREFFHYVSGELAQGFAEVKLADGKTVVRLTHNELFPTLRCHYDPYGLDTNGDCNACEKY